MEKIKFVNGADRIHIYDKLNDNKRYKFNFLNNHDLYWAKNESKFKKTILGKENVNFIDGATVSLFLSLKNLWPIRRYRGPVLTKNILQSKSLSKDRKHLFIGLEKPDLEILAEKLLHLKLRNLFSYNPPFIKGIEFPKEDIGKIVDLINKNKIDFVWIGVGCPKQNILGHEIYERTNTKIIFNVGAAIDFLLEKKPQSGGIFQAMGIEWLYRLITDFKYSYKKVWRSLIALRHLRNVQLDKSQ